MTLTELLGLTMRPLFNVFAVWYIEFKLRGIERDLAYFQRQREEGFEAERWLHLNRVRLVSQLRSINKG